MASDEQEALNDVEAARFIGMSISYLRMDRAKGPVGNRTPGPPYLRIGRRIRYRKRDLVKWLERHRVKRPEPEA